MADRKKELPNMWEAQNDFHNNKLQNYREEIKEKVNDYSKSPLFNAEIKQGTPVEPEIIPSKNNKFTQALDEIKNAYIDRVNNDIDRSIKKADESQEAYFNDIYGIHGTAKKDKIDEINAIIGLGVPLLEFPMVTDAINLGTVGYELFSGKRPFFTESIGWADNPEIKIKSLNSNSRVGGFSTNDYTNMELLRNPDFLKKLSKTEVDEILKAKSIKDLPPEIVSRLKIMFNLNGYPKDINGLPNGSPYTHIDIQKRKKLGDVIKELLEENKKGFDSLGNDTYKTLNRTHSKASGLESIDISQRPKLKKYDWGEYVTKKIGPENAKKLKIGGKIFGKVLNALSAYGASKIINEKLNEAFSQYNQKQAEEVFKIAKPFISSYGLEEINKNGLNKENFMKYVKPIYFDENLQKVIQNRIIDYNKSFDYINSKYDDKEKVMQMLDERLNNTGFYDLEKYKKLNQG